MQTYAYEALTHSGQPVEGELAAENVSAAIQQLEARDLSVRSIRMISVGTPGPASAEPPAFYRHIEAALQHRDALIQALEAFVEDVNSKSAARRMRQLIAELRRGATAEEFLRHPSAAAWLPLLLRSPALTVGGDGFQQLVEQATRESESSNVRRRMLLYPLVVLVAALVLGVFLLSAVVPSFSKLYSEFGIHTTAPTRLVVWLSEQLLTSAVLFFVTLVLVALAVYTLARLWLRNALTTRLLGTFIGGNSLSVAAMARFTGTLGELLALDAPLPDAIRIAGRASEHPYYRQLAEELAVDAQRTSDRLLDSRAACAFPGNVIYALTAGVDGGPSVPLLRELSSLYSDRIGQRFDWSTGIIGPLTLLAAGVFVAFFVIALLMPLFTMIHSLT